MILARGDMFTRNIFKTLKSWSESSYRKPLVLRGARQVGKTTAVTELASQYDIFLKLNLELKADRDLFEHDYDIEALITAIHFYKNQPVNREARTLIFIDEIQNSPQAAAILRYFYEERNDIHVIAAGSLLETLIGRHINFPVGRVEYLWLYPVTFTEYLSAINEHEAVALMQQQPCPDFAHDKLLKLFHDYTLVGGMPEAIQTYTRDRDILAVNKIYENLMTAYMDDVEKYAPNRTLANVIRHVIQQAPLEAGSRIKFQGFGQSNYKSREVGESLRLLEKALLLQLVYPTTQTMPPATPDHKKSPKLQFLDTGLINFTAGLQQYYFTLNDLNSLYKGRISENIIGQELLANQVAFNQHLTFWVREQKQSNAEVDFVIPYDRYLIPVEVKSGKTGTLRSLMQYMELAEHPYAIRLYAGKRQLDTLQTPSGKSFTLLSLPYYLAWRLPENLAQFVEFTQKT
jgi:predicted AAA+ superfamily ATPase